jgi:hypothetical protein
MKRARPARRSVRVALATTALLALAPATHAAPGRGIPRFTTSTPARLVVNAGETVSIQLAASSSSGTVAIGALAVPTGGSLHTTPAATGTAIFRWTAPAIGNYAVTFTARNLDPPRLAITRNLLLVVRPAPINLDGINNSWYWAYVNQPVNVHTWPSHRAPLVTELETSTPEGTANLVLLSKSYTTPDGSLWYQARLPILPNNTTGWLPATALGTPVKVTTHLVIDRQALTATLYQLGRQIFQTPIGIGTPAAPTPAGEYYVRDLLLNFNNPFYGPAAYGTSARSSVLTDWPDEGHIGIHGTNQPELIPGRISHGCIRMTNTAILHLIQLMPIGTPITIR